MTTETGIGVAIIEDEPVFREGYAQLIHGTPGYRCVGTFKSVDEALRLIDRVRPDVLLLDINLPGIPGTEGVRLLKAKYPTVAILMLTILDAEEKIFESLCNGACGYLLKNTPPVKLLEAIREAHEQGGPMSPEVARKVVLLFQKTGPTETLEQNLTPYELRLLGLLADGYSYQGVADRLGISINTVRKHVCHIYEKLHVHSKTEAVRKALKNRLIY